VVTGLVALVLQDSDLQYVKKGDIIVSYSSSASFNMVLGLCSGIVTNYGGMLSHAAIVAREYGIPGKVWPRGRFSCLLHGYLTHFLDSSPVQPLWERNMPPKNSSRVT
jgi:hypothetical protein